MINPNFYATNKLISNGTREEKLKRDRLAQKMIKNVEVMNLKDMKKHGDEVYDAHVANETALIEAFNNKQLKSKNLIKRAKKIIKKREEFASKKKED